MLRGQQTSSISKSLDIESIIFSDIFLKDELIEIFSKDLTKDIAGPFINGLLSNIRSLEDVRSNYVDAINNIYNSIIYGFAEDVKEKCSYSGAIPLCIARDAWPVYWALNKLDACPAIAYLTRGIFGEKDEINKELRGGASKEDILAYLKQETAGRPFIIIDTGMYGSLVQVLASWSELKDKLAGVMFIFSKNPNIYGFLNREWSIDVKKLVDESISQDVLNAFIEGKLDKNTRKCILANIIIDSLECVHPMWMKSPTKLVNNNGVYRPILEKQAKSQIGQEFLNLGWKAMKSAYSKPNGDVLGLDKLEQLVEAAKSEFTGVLHTITPEWSKKPEFLKSWVAGKLYPLENGN